MRRPPMLRRDRRRTLTPEFEKHVENARQATLAGLDTALAAAEDAAGWLDAYPGASEMDRREATGIVERIRLLRRSIDPPDYLAGFVFETPATDDAVPVRNPDFGDASPWTEMPEYEPPTKPSLSSFDTQEVPVVRIDSSQANGLAADRTTRPVEPEAEVIASPDVIVIDEDDIPEVEA